MKFTFYGFLRILDLYEWILYILRIFMDFGFMKGFFIFFRFLRIFTDFN